MKFDRVWHSIDRWEEIESGMWSDVSDHKSMLDRAIEFTGDHELYGLYMKKVVEEWPVSCENALTDYSMNRKAWVGHAACAMAMNCPEDITRKAWGYLSEHQQEMANRQADSAIRSWEYSYGKGKGLFKNMEEQVLL